VLVLAGDPYHPADDVIRGLRSAGDDEFTFELAPDGPLEGLVSEFSAMVLAKMNVTSPTDSAPWTRPDSEFAIREFVSAGKGLLVIHAGSAGYNEAPILRKVTGGAFLHHPEPCDVTITPTKVDTDGEGVGPFTVFDEHYFVEVDSEAEVFLTATSFHGVQPAGWTLGVGRGRVCMIAPGHFAPIWIHPEFQQLLRNSLNWVSNG
jgi:uncharacterized protein